jgi:hypothetical protein
MMGSPLHVFRIHFQYLLLIPLVPIFSKLHLACLTRGGGDGHIVGVMTFFFLLFSSATTLLSY